jgi:hypothetical protein
MAGLRYAKIPATPWLVVVSQVLAALRDKALMMATSLSLHWVYFNMILFHRRCRYSLPARVYASIMSDVYNQL